MQDNNSVTDIVDTLNREHLDILKGTFTPESSQPIIRLAMVCAPDGYDPAIAYALDDLAETVRRMPEVSEETRGWFTHAATWYAKRETRVTA